MNWIKMGKPKRMLVIGKSSGCRKETHCEFCDCQLPDWKKTLTPQCGANAPAVMNVNFDGRTYSFEVRPGPDGYKQFTEAIRKAFNLPDDSELNITFTCDEPVAVPDAPPPTPPPTIPGKRLVLGIFPYVSACSRPPFKTACRPASYTALVRYEICRSKLYLCMCI